MDAITLLKQDHREVEALFEKFESLGDRAYKGKAQVVSKIIQALKTHAELEETIFYPAFREGADDEDLALEAYEEHHVVKFLIAELELMQPEDERYDAKVTVLKELIEHHVEEEEQTMFPEAQKALGKDEIEALGQQMENARPRVEAHSAGARISITMLQQEVLQTKKRT